MNTNPTFEIPQVFVGELACSKCKQVKNTAIHVRHLNNSLYRIFFSMDDVDISFMAMIDVSNEQEEIIVHESIKDNYLIKGIAGMNVQNNGDVAQAESLYFNLVIDFFEGDIREFYFTGAPALEAFQAA